MTSFPTAEIRARFPALADAQTVYLDNPAGTQVPGSVIEAVARSLETASSNLGGRFGSSVRAGENWHRGHEAMAEFVGAGSMREIVIGQSMTALTFHMSRCLGRTMQPGDEIIVTRMDHEGNVSPWLALAEDRGLTVRWLPFDRESWRIEPQDLAALLNDRTRLVALNYASNLTGSINDVATLARIAREAGALTYVDAVQFAPHSLIDVQALGCDFLVCSSYKFFGPHLGILWGRESLLQDLAAYKVRCASNELPERFELGTPQVELLAGVAAAVDYLAWVGTECGASTGDRRGALAAGFAASTEYETGLARRLIDGLSAIDGVRIHGITNPNRGAERVPTVSFTHARVAPPAIAQALAARGICVWSGHNYAYEVVRHLGIDERTGVLRVGAAHYNTAEEIDRTLEAIAAAVS